MKSNLEKLKTLSEEIISNEEKDTKKKKDTVNCLKKIHGMLEEAYVDRDRIMKEIKGLISKLS